MKFKEWIKFIRELPKTIESLENRQLNYKSRGITEWGLWRYSLDELKEKLKELKVEVLQEEGTITKGAWKICGFVAHNPLAEGMGLWIGSTDDDIWTRYALCLSGAFLF